MIKNDCLLVNYLDQGDYDKNYKWPLENMALYFLKCYVSHYKDPWKLHWAISRDTGPQAV